MTFTKGWTFQKARLQVNIDKCKFHIQKPKFFGFIVFTERIQINLQKVKSILD